MNSTPVVIPFSKAKLVKLLIYSILFLAAGLWMLIAQPVSDNPVFDNALVKNGAGLGGIIMGALGIFYFTRKLFNRKPAIIIDETGITDNSGALSLGLIPWSDILEIRERSVQASIVSKQKFVMIVLKNPGDYIAKQTNRLRRKAMEANTKYAGSPVSISANGLKTGFEELKKLLETRLTEYKSK